jgi:hypothetical protein
MNVKLPFLAGGLCTLLTCSGPRSTLSVSLAFPPVPPAWETLLPSAQWKLEWVDPQGLLRMETLKNPSGTLDLAADRSSPVLAYPFWPSINIPPGLVKPCGAIFPFDLQNTPGDTLLGWGKKGEGVLQLSWIGGVAGYFFKALAASEGDQKTVPERFDWPRFGALLKDPALSPAVREDPWLVDWLGVAQRTRASGFDRRRLVPRPQGTLSLLVPAEGPWVNGDPFVPPPPWTVGSRVELSALEEPGTLFSPSGFLRYSTSGWAWFPGP